MAAMRIGTLSRRTGVPVKALRTYEDMDPRARRSRA